MREKKERHVQKNLKWEKINISDRGSADFNFYFSARPYFWLILFGPIRIADGTKFGPAKNADQKMDQLKNHSRVLKGTLDRHTIEMILLA